MTVQDRAAEAPRADPTRWSRPGPGAQRVIPPAVALGDTIRLLHDTCSTEVRAPDGGIKFPTGLVVLVDDYEMDAITARRWVRNRIAEVFPGGVPGDIVTAEERTADPDDLEAQIGRLRQLQERARTLAAERAAAPPERLEDPEAAIGTARYREGPAARPLAVYGLADAQVEALEHAGFTRPDIIDAATDDELLDIKGIGRGTLRRLRGQTE